MHAYIHMCERIGSDSCDDGINDVMFIYYDEQ